MNEPIAVIYPRLLSLNLETNKSFYDPLPKNIIEIYDNLAVLKTKKEWLSFPKLTVFDEYSNGNKALASYRDEYLKNCGYALHTKETIDTLVIQMQGKKVLDVGCGTGYLVSLLEKQNIDIFGIDYYKPVYHFRKKQVTPSIIVENSVSYLKKFKENFEVIILSWPCLNSPFAYKIAKLMVPGQLLYFLGESEGGATADDAFFEYIHPSSLNFLYQENLSDQLNENHLQFEGIYDRWKVYEKLKIVDEV